MYLKLKLSAVLLTAIALSGPTASAALSTVNLSGQDVVFDDASSLYWYPDLQYFGNKEYGEQITLIGDLNTSIYAGFSNWALANPSQLASLLGLQDLARATEISTLFSPGNPAEDEWLGRYEDGPAAGSHYIAGPEISPFGFTGLASIAETDDTENKQLGAWAVASQAQFDPPSAPVPGALLMAMMGLGSLSAARRRIRTSS